MNKVAHGVILAFFGMACWFVSVVFKLPTMLHVGSQLPLFTRLCMEIGPMVVGGLAILATVYCLWVWIRKADSRTSWVAFLATTMAALVFVMLPAIVAIYLPLVAALNHLASK
jgi:hypothetical protein